MHSRMRLVIAGAVSGAVIGAVAALLAGRIAANRGSEGGSAVARQGAPLDVRRMVPLASAIFRVIKEIAAL